MAMDDHLKSIGVTTPQYAVQALQNERAGLSSAEKVAAQVAKASRVGTR
jgi:hypothetical protein